ncbi:hypothetical protein MRX96_013349 [Rhipicephalus microplus]
MAQNTFVSQEDAPSPWRMKNPRWLSEGSSPVRKINQRTPEPYFWRESPKRQPAPIECGRTFFTPPPSPRNWTDKPCQHSRRGSINGENLQAEEQAFWRSSSSLSLACSSLQPGSYCETR